MITSNKNHPSFKFKEVETIYYNKQIDFNDLFTKLREKHNMKRITIQSGGTLNSTLVRNGLIDRVSLVIAPALVGGKDTSTLLDGESLRTVKDLKKIKSLKLIKCEKLNNSYLHLIYYVIN